MSTAQRDPSTVDWTWRRRFSGLTVVVTVLLISWGGVVTSIGAGMAFPDWPTSLGSYNLINPVDEWWTVPAYLAEHGHRLIASLVGILTVILSAWTWWSDPRRWMRQLGLWASVLVIVQGVLGGLRVLWVSLDLAMIHACVAQLFFAVVVAMTVFTTDTWRDRTDILPRTDATTLLRRLAYGTTGAIYLQIVLGALLRHSGAGVSPGFVTFHVAGAFAVVGLVFAVVVSVEKHVPDVTAVRVAAWSMFAALGLQFILGLATLLVMLYAVPETPLSLVSVLLTVGHLVFGAVLFGTSIVVTLLVSRRGQAAARGDGTESSMREVAAAAVDA